MEDFEISISDLPVAPPEPLEDPNKAIIDAIEGLKQVVKSVKDKDYSAGVASKLGEIRVLLDKVLNRPMPAPEVSVAVNQEDVIKKIEEANNEIKESIEMVKAGIDELITFVKADKQWVHEIVEGQYGKIIQVQSRRVVISP